MYVNVIYKEVHSPITKAISKIEIIEVDENEATAHKYAKLFSLQLPADDKNKIFFRIVQIKVN